ncbi:MAG TPA: ABC transporter substrate-binding protein, partial [Pseudonocardiaceae bacterium]
MKTSRTVLALLIALAVAAVTAGCSRLEASNAAGNTPAADKGPAAELRLGYFPNVTHAPALIGVEKGFFTKELGSTKLSTQTFNSGTEASAALLGGSLDLTFIGSGPTINAFDKSKGEALRLISGVNYGGAQLVARPEIENAEQLRGKKIAAPQRGNTQDVALRKWLAEKNLPAGGGPDQVSVINGDNPQTF